MCYNVISSCFCVVSFLFYLSLSFLIFIFYLFFVCFHLYVPIFYECLSSSVLDVLGLLIDLLIDILPLTDTFKHNKGTLIHKIYYDKTPHYLSQLLTKAPDRYRSRALLPPLPRIDITKTSLSFSGSIIWNNLPPTLKENMSTYSFRYKLHNFLLGAAKIT